jgi:hypothetical protein
MSYIYATIYSYSSEFGASFCRVKEELAQLSETDLLKSEKSGRQVNYRANTEYPLFPVLEKLPMLGLWEDRHVTERRESPVFAIH